MLKFPISEYFSLLSYTQNRRPVRLTVVIAVDLMSFLVDLELFCDLVDREVGNLEVDRPCRMRSSGALLLSVCHPGSCQSGLVACRRALGLPSHGIVQGIVVVRS